MKQAGVKAAKSSGRSTARFAWGLLAALMGAFLAACSASEPARPTLISDDPSLVLWPRAEKGVRLRFRADRDLNAYDGRAHSLQVLVYQMDKPGAFIERAKTWEGLMTLFQAEPFDPSVKNVARLFIQPFETAFFEMDRVEDAKYIGIACGYFEAVPEKSAKVWEIKPQTEKTGILFKSKVMYSAGTFDLALRLTADAMLEEDAIVKEAGSARDETGQRGASQNKPTARWIKQETQ